MQLAASRTTGKGRQDRGVFAVMVFAALLMVVSGWEGRAQSLSVFDVDASGFPVVKAKFYVFDYGGLQISGLTPGDFLVKEDGYVRPVQRVTCPPAQPANAVSAVLAIDVSGSMRGDGHTISQAAARAFVRAMPLGNSECAITSFNDRSAINLDFSTDSTALLTAIDGLTVGGMTDYNAALLDTPTGALEVAARGRAKRIVVFLSDGQPNDPPDQAAIIARAVQAGVTVYAVMIRMVAPPEVRNFCAATGGQWFENVQNELEITEIYRRILLTAQGGAPCEIEWLSEGCRTAHTTSFTIAAHAATDTVRYVVPESVLPQIDYTPSFAMHFGEVLPGTLSQHPVTITAVGRAARIDSVRGTDPRFRVADYGGPVPFTLDTGESRTLTIEFAPGDSTYVFSTFTVYGDECMGANFYADGGWRGKSSPRIRVRVARPNGGEGFVVATDELLVWENVMPDEKVRLEYSIDNGAQWRVIADSATGLQYLWRVPRTPSTTCLLRATAHMPATFLEDLAEIPAGDFQMGDITGNGTFPEERPVHDVRITRPFLMGRTEVTQAQWLTVMADNPSHFKSDSLPVEGVRWVDAIEFCNRLSIQERLDTCYTWSGDTVFCNFAANGFRLPTEAEWEYACRAGTQTDFYTGDMTEPGCDPLDGALDRAGWYCGNEDQTTRLVARLLPNAFGLFDMHGNVFEWCWDRYADDSYGPGPEIDPTGPKVGTTRVVRGGSFAASADLCRSSRRSGNYPTDRFNDIGFRIVRLK